MSIETKTNQKGFTLLEIMISVALFMTIFVMSSGSIYSIFDANGKSQNLRSVMDNLNYTLESMTRTIRFGSVYHCDVTVLPVTSTRDCGTGANSIVFKDYTGAMDVVYNFSSNSITKSVDGGTTYTTITSPDVTITDLKFRVIGSTIFCSTSCGSKDTNQPRVIINVSGYVGAKNTTRSSFTLQSIVSQRKFDAMD
jgi:Tfp pilus assembly protein FimT